MESEKFENLLNLALNATERERQKSLNLGVGYEPQENRWELIVKYSGDINRLSRENKEIKVEELSNEYAILNVPESAMDQVAKAVEVELIIVTLIFGMQMEALGFLPCMMRPWIGSFPRRKSIRR